MRLGDEYTGFIVDAYAVQDHPSNNHLRYDSAFLSRPKGTNKSGLGAYLALWEALGPCRFAGWARGGEVYEDPWQLGFRYVYSAGEPMGRPVTAPFIRCLATEESQVSNVYATIHYNLTSDQDDPPLSYVPGVDVGLERVLLPRGGEIRVSTASSSAKDGGKETFCVLDETHLYNTPELKRMYRTVTRNMRKRKKIAGTWFLETTTMFAPGEESMAEATYTEAEALREGRKKRGRHRLLFDHRWGDCKDPSDEVELRQALREAYGDAMAWMDLDSLVDEFYDLRNQIADSRRYFLNAKTSAADAWIAEHEWSACKRTDRRLKRRDLVCLGLDGSVRRDATALVAVGLGKEVRGHLQLLGLWERPDGADEDWRVPTEEVHAAVVNAMKFFEVAGFYMDPAHFQDYCDRWTHQFGERMQVRATKAKPLEFWTNRPTAMVATLDRFYEAVQGGAVSYTPADDLAGRDAELALALTRHVLNARRKVTNAGLQIRKEHQHSEKKIDACMAAVLAYEAMSDGVALGITPTAGELLVPKRIR